MRGKSVSQIRFENLNTRGTKRVSRETIGLDEGFWQYLQMFVIGPSIIAGCALLKWSELPHMMPLGKWWLEKIYTATWCCCFPINRTYCLSDFDYSPCENHVEVNPVQQLKTAVHISDW